MTKHRKDTHAFIKKMKELGSRARKLPKEKKIAWLNAAVAQLAEALGENVDMENLRREVFARRRSRWIKKFAAFTKVDYVDLDLWLILDAQMELFKKTDQHDFPYDEITEELESLLPLQKAWDHGLNSNILFVFMVLTALFSFYYSEIHPTSELLRSIWQVFALFVWGLFVVVAVKEKLEKKR